MTKRSSDAEVGNMSRSKIACVELPEVESIEHFKDIIKNNSNGHDYVVFDFYADWCPPCRKIGHRLPDLIESFPKAKFYKVNRDRCPDVHQACSIQKIPIFQVYDVLTHERLGSLQHSDYDTVYEFLEEMMSDEF